jgi:hypothetical protein
MAATSFEKGDGDGLEKVREFLAGKLEQKCGPLPEHVRQRLATWPLERLVQLGAELNIATSLDELGFEGEGTPS